MNSTPNRIIRFILRALIPAPQEFPGDARGFEPIRFIFGALIPVPLFIGIYYFSYFYNSYHGFDHESKTYLTSTADIAMSRKHLKTDVVILLLMGYLMMGIPSLAYSYLLERHRSGSRYKLRSYVGWGALMGGLVGFIAFGFDMEGGLYDSLPDIAITTAVGASIPLLMAAIFPQRGIQKHRVSKPAHPNSGNAPF